LRMSTFRTTFPTPACFLYQLSATQERGGGMK
jgi:hypothetical protein